MVHDIFKLLYVIGFVTGSVIRGVYTRGYRRKRIARDCKTASDALLMIPVSVGMIVLPFLCLLTSWLDFADYHSPAWIGAVGAAVFAISLWLLWRSHVDLGRNWTPTLQIVGGHSLVTGGIYRHIRHPMYAAHWLWGIAQVLLLHNWVAGPAFLVLFLPLYLVRVPREERMMLDHFGEEYSSYINRTGRVVPRFRG